MVEVDCGDSARGSAEAHDDPGSTARSDGSDSLMQVSKPRLLLFAFGDFAFNLYWQSVMMFLLFYYTDSIDLPIGIAAITYMVASVWDGIANFGAGMILER